MTLFTIRRRVKNCRDLQCMKFFTWFYNHYHHIFCTLKTNMMPKGFAYWHPGVLVPISPGTMNNPVAFISRSVFHLTRSNISTCILSCRWSLTNITATSLLEMSSPSQPCTAWWPCFIQYIIKCCSLTKPVFKILGSVMVPKLFNKPTDHVGNMSPLGIQATEENDGIR